LTIALVVVVACGDDDAVTTAEAATTTFAEQTTTTTAVEETTTTIAAQTTTVEETTTTTTAFAGDTGPETGDAGPGILSGTLVDVRWAQREEGFTRVVFDFGGTAVPAYDVRYAPGPFYQMGDPDAVLVPVDGNAFLQVTMNPARRWDLSVDPIVQTYLGDDRIILNTASVTEVVFIEDFEAHMIWVIGVTEEKPFAVGTLTEPPRIYIDIAD
jgi:hypothetical protein